MAAMAVFATVIVAALLLEDKHFVGFALLKHLRFDHRASHDGRANEVFVARKRQNLVDFYSVANIHLEFFNFDDAACGYAVLFATGDDNCVHSALSCFCVKRRRDYTRGRGSVNPKHARP
jgi:hypothetical protein